jgi:hypothetical protein
MPSISVKYEKLLPALPADIVTAPFAFEIGSTEAKRFTMPLILNEPVFYRNESNSAISRER